MVWASQPYHDGEKKGIITAHSKVWPMNASDTRPPIEQEIEAFARQQFHGEWWMDSRLAATGVHLEGEYPDTKLVVTFTHATRPGCEFGFRFLLAAGSSYEDGYLKDDPESLTFVAEANLLEEIEASDMAGLPRDCKPGEVTWL